MNETRPTVATIDLQALQHNVAWLKQQAGERALACAVKADAYGHGAVTIAKALDVPFLCVALVSEGILLRQAGVQTPILVLGGALDGAFEALHAYRLTPVIHRLEHLEQYAHGPFHLKIDTGMSRLGLPVRDIEAFVALLAQHKNLHFEGVMTHFADADVLDNTTVEQQVSLFRTQRDVLKRHGLQPRYVHMSNSAAMLSGVNDNDNMARPGLAIYGINPLPGHNAPLKPVMRWTTRPVLIKDVPVGTRVGYGGTWTAPRPSRLATLPVGYGDGYRRIFSNRAHMLVRGQRVPVVGVVSMDLTVIDITDVPGVDLSDEVVLLGQQGSEVITANELARHAETNPWEIVTCVGARVPRRVV